MLEETDLDSFFDLSCYLGKMIGLTITGYGALFSCCGVNKARLEF